MEKAALQERPKTKTVAKGNPANPLQQLSQTPVTQLVQNYNATKQETDVILANQQLQAKNQLPKIKESEGSAYNQVNKNNLKAKTDLSKSKAKNYAFQAPLYKANKKETKFPEQSSIKKINYAFQAGGTLKIEKQAQSQLDAVSLNTNSIPTTMQEQAHVDLTGEANVNQLSKEENDKAQQVNAQKNIFAKDVYKDYGENNIIDKPNNHLLQATTKPKVRHIVFKTITEFTVNGIDSKLLDENFQPIIQTKIGDESNKFQDAQTQHNQKVEDEETTADGKIDAEKQKSQKSQLKSVKDAHKDVNKSRTDWQNELNTTETNFINSATTATKNNIKEITKAKTAGENTAQGHIKKANAEAKTAKDKADKEATDKKNEKKKESGGFFGWLADKASALINALKDALNYIFTKLRDAVKAIFNFAKKLVLAALELARKAIVGLIKTFGTLLKKFVDLALAAFPKLQDKIKAKIDHYVATAEKYVNQAFEIFKKVVTAIIDALAKVVDSLLGLLQTIYSGILTVVSMIVSGDILGLLEKLGNIKDALFAITFATIKQGGMEELLGADLDESLSPEELMAAMQMGLLSGGNEQESNAGMPKAPWTNANVGVDVVSFEELAPEMQAELRRMQKAGQSEATMGENNDPSRTMNAVMQEANAPQNAPETSDKKFNDGLTPMKRAEIKWEMMKTGIKQWWDNNWIKIVGGIIAALVVFIAAEVVTGGAITAALPVLMPILEQIFVGVMVAQFAGYLTDGLGKSWVGDIKGGTKAFSRGLGAALIELAMYLGFKAIELAAKGITKLVKGAVNLIKKGAKAVMDFGKFIIQEGKVLFKGIAGKNLGKLSKSLRKLADDIMERMRIKKVLLRLEPKLWKVEAEINPLFVIMSGPMPDEEIGEIIKADNNALNKSLKKGETYIDDQGRELMKISTLDEFTRTPDYREIFALANKRGISEDVIHHLIEKGSDFAHLFDKKMINAPKSLRAIPKGDINSVLHLSDIRTAWDDVYKTCNQLLKEGGTTSDVKSLILQFAGKTDDFIEKSLIKIAQQESLLGLLSKQQISDITNGFKYLLK